MTGSPIVLKFGGELIEDPARLAAVVSAVAAVAASTPLVIVHGGGREIDAALGAVGIEKRQVDGLRITDEATLRIVVSTLAGAVNTRFVAALGAAGVPAVGLTGADGSCGRAHLAPVHQTVDGRCVDLGRVGIPAPGADMRLLGTLVDDGFVPVIASIGVGDDGQLLNVNADTFAGHLAARLGARRLVIAGTTAGVLDPNQRTIRTLDAVAVSALVGDGTASAGMIAKLRACEHALAHGAGDVVIVDGRDRQALVDAVSAEAPAGATRLIADAPTRA